MATFVESKDEFETLRGMLLERVSEKEFESNPFDERYNHYIGFEFDFIYKRSFFEGIKQFLKRIGDSKVCFYTLDPSPIEYFYRSYGKYSVFEIDAESTDEELNEIMTKAPAKDSADSVSISSDLVAWFSNSIDWVILGSRDWEISIVGFTNLEIKTKFLESFSEDAQTMFTSLEAQAEALDEMLCFDSDIKKAYQKLVENYRNKST